MAIIAVEEVRHAEERARWEIDFDGRQGYEEKARLVKSSVGISPSPTAR